MSPSPAGRTQPGTIALLTVNVSQETDIVAVRQRARQLALLLGFDHQDQVRIATATSEIARNAYQYAGGGRVQFAIDLDRQFFTVRVSDHGPGIADADAILRGRFRSQSGMGLGIVGTRRLMDSFSLESEPGKGTTVVFGKVMPPTARRMTGAEVARLSAQLTSETAQTPFEELRQQNLELLAALDTVRTRESELEQRQAELGRLNQELQETNRGVVALYAELEENAEELRRANEIKSRFLSHMSHEFRTPLNSILALSNLLLDRMDGDLTPAQEKQVGYVRRAAEELFEMVNDLLDLAKVEAGKVEVHLGEVDIGQLFGAIRGLLRPLASNPAVTLTFEEPGAPLLVHSDEAKIGQILRNLVSNALKFTEHGEVRVSAQRQGPDVLLTVCDTGIGIAPADQTRIFKDFAQIDSPIQRRVKGTGLGLSLSRRLAELLGGALTVDSQLGVGSTFTLRVPVGDVISMAEGGGAAHTRGEHESVTQLKEESPGCVLVIDDEEVARYLVRQMFRGTHYRIIEAATGREGAERARFDQPRLILLDLTMPGGSGFDALDELKSDPATAHIPVVIHTSRTLRAGDLHRLAGRHTAVLPKQPAGREHAIAFIRDILDEPYLFATAAQKPLE